MLLSAVALFNSALCTLHFFLAHLKNLSKNKKALAKQGRISVVPP